MSGVRIKIRHGTSTPTSTDLLENELGFNSSANELFIGKNNRSPYQLTYSILPISKGGTGSSTASGALSALGAVKKSGDTMTNYLNFKNSGIQDLAGRIGLSTNNSLSKNYFTIRATNLNLNTIYANLRLYDDRWDVTKPYNGYFSLYPPETNTSSLCCLSFLNNKGQKGVGLYGPSGTLDSQDNCRFWIRLYSYDGTDFLNYYEDYYLPAASSNLSSNKSYNILTTKNTITIAQGGTGATSANGVLTNLGLSDVVRYTEVNSITDP